MSNPFNENCMRAEYNAEYSRLQHLIQTGLITSEEFFSQLKALQNEYADILGGRKDE